MVAAPRMLLASMPYMTPNIASLALATLRPLLEAAGIETDTLHGSLLFPRTESDNTFLERHGQFLFAPHLYPEVPVDQIIDAVLRRYLEDLDRNCFAVEKVSWEYMGLDEQRERERIRGDIARAGQCLDRCFERATAHEYDVVGFSLTFETQVPAAVALARRLKARRPATKIVFGGAACVGEQADGLLTTFDVIDVVCHSEGESVIVPLVRALRGEGVLTDVPGIAFREGGGLRHQASPPQLTDLDQLPMPIYDDFLTEVARSDWADLPLKLFFETSRGCWWGQKHLCTFCGLNADGLVFRAKSAERAYREIEHLYNDYPAATLLQASDNILHMSYFDSLLPRLAEMPRDPARPLRMFFEIKSNLRPEQVALLAAAGMDGAQPGIESFSDHVLELMDKGCRGLGQAAFVKWMAQEQITPIYNILFGSPGERPEDYRQMLGLLPFLDHLPPPVGITRLELMRFSPYFERPDHFAIENVRPKAHYRDLYHEPTLDLMRMSYEFDFDHVDHRDAELAAAHREFALEILRWQRRYKPWRLYWVERGAGAVIVDQRRGREHTEALAPAATEVFRYLDQPRSRARLAAHFPDLEPGFIDALLERWQHRRWVYQAPGGELLATVPLRHEGARDIRKVIAAAARRREPKARPLAPAPERRLPVLAG